MKFLYFLLISLLPLSILSQEANDRFLISGNVFDADTHSALQFITITLQDVSTYEIIGDITNKQGEFELSVPKGKYNCVVESLSFSPFIIKSLSVNQDLELGNIELKQNVEELDEVEVVAKNKLMDYKFSKKIYKASKDISNIGGNAITVLENTPSVRVNDEGTIIIRGNTAKVLVDGKPYGGKNSNADILSLIPASSIKDIEILTRSAKYEAEGGGEIINIVLKKGINEGYNGTIEVHGGYPDNDGLSAFINLKTDKVNLFSTASYNHNVEIKNTNIDQLFIDNNNQPTGSFDQKREDHRQKNSILFNIGSDFYLDKKNTLTTSLLYSNTNKNYDSELFLNDYQPVDNLIKSTVRNVGDDSDESFIEAYINYTAKFNEEGHQLSFDMNFDKTTSKNNTNLFDKESFPNSDETKQKYKKDELVDTYYFQLEYALPFKNESQLELGHRSSFRVYENDFFANNYNPITNTYDFINGFSNKVKYNENVYAFYANYSQQLDKISYSIGLRTEISQTEIKEDSQNLTETNNYTDFFPSASISYSFNNGNFLSASYSRTLDRPEIFQLNPFNSFTDERFIRSGNPFLKPSYYNSFAIEYNVEFEKIYLNTAIFYTNSTDTFLTVLEETGNQTDDGFDIYKSYPINNGDLDYIGLEIGATYNPSKKFRFYGLISPYYSVRSNTIENEYDYENFVFYGTAALYYRLNNTLRFQVNFDYISPQKTALTEIGEYYYTNFTASKDLFDNKATLTFKMSDVFHTRKAMYKSIEADAISNRDVVFKTRYLLSFTYRFNKARKRNANNRARDIDRNVFEIEDRIK